MPASKKSKKVLIQFAIALVVAVAMGLGAITVGFYLITTINNNATTAKKAALKKAEEAQAELDQLRRQKEEESAQQQATPQGVPLVQTQVALSPGTVITEDMVTLAQSRDANQKDGLHNLTQAVGKMVKAPVPNGIYLKASDLIDADTWLQVPPGQRAITIHVDASGSISGTLVSGSKVDILATIPSGTEGMATTRTVLQDALVMRVESGFGGGGGSGKPVGMQSAITLLVTPKQAELLTLAGQVGTFRITLRNNEDVQTMSNDAGIDTAALLEGKDSKIKPSTPVVTVVKSKPKTSATAKAYSNPNEETHTAANFSPNAALPSPGEGGKIGGGQSNRFSMKIFRGSGSEVVEFQR